MCEKATKILSKDLLSRLTCIKPNIAQLKVMMAKISEIEQLKEPINTELQGDLQKDKRLIKLMLLKLIEFA